MDNAGEEKESVKEMEEFCDEDVEDDYDAAKPKGKSIGKGET